MKKMHVDNIVQTTTATKPATTTATEPAKTSALEPASTKASMPASTNVPKTANNVTPGRPKKTVWKIVPNLTTQEVNNLLEDEEEM